MPSIHNAKGLAKLDSLGSSVDSFNIENSLPAISQVCGEFIKRVQRNIQAEGLNATGKISQLQIEEVGNGINIVAPLHLIYQDKGVSGTERKFNTPFAYTNKMPPPNKIKEWIKLKGIQTKNAGKFFDKKVDIEEGAAFAIAKSIQKKGIEPKNVYTKEIPSLIEGLKETVAQATVNEIIKSFNRVNI